MQNIGMNLFKNVQRKKIKVERHDDELLLCTLYNY